MFSAPNEVTPLTDLAMYLKRQFSNVFVLAPFLTLQIYCVYVGYTYQYLAY